MDKEKLLEAAKPLIKFLKENYHPHATAIVTTTSVEVLSGEMIITDIFDLDE